MHVSSWAYLIDAYNWICNSNLTGWLSWFWLSSLCISYESSLITKVWCFRCFCVQLSSTHYYPWTKVKLIMKYRIRWYSASWHAIMINRLSLDWLRLLVKTSQTTKRGSKGKQVCYLLDKTLPHPAVHQGNKTNLCQHSWTNFGKTWQ